MSPADEHPLPPEPPEPTEPVPPNPDEPPPEVSQPFESAPLPRRMAQPAVRAVPEDLHVPWNWTDLLIFGIVVVAATIFFSVALMIGFAAFGVSTSVLRQPGSEQSFFALVAQVVLFAVLLGYLALQIRLRTAAPFWPTIGWRGLSKLRAPRFASYAGILAFGFAFAAAIEFLSGVLGTKAKLPIETMFQDRRSAILFMVTAVLVAPVIEETIFRGYIYPVVARSFGVATGVIATGVLFGLLHAPQLWGGWGQIGLLVVVGIVFTWARAATRTVVASYLLHLSYNSLVCLVFLVASHGLRHLPGGQ
jgi:uncharacterized protein